MKIHFDFPCGGVLSKVEIHDFDPSDAECSTGFHFFCTRDEAEKYN